jgi:hypothetical protein
MPPQPIPTTSAAHCEAGWDATSPTRKLAVSQREPARAGFGSLRDGNRSGRRERRCRRRLATAQLSGMVGRRGPAGGTLDGSDRSKAVGVQRSRCDAPQTAVGDRATARHALGKGKEAVPARLP